MSRPAGTIAAGSVQAGHDAPPGQIAGLHDAGLGYGASDAVAQDSRKRRQHRRVRRPAGPHLRLDEGHVGELHIDDDLAMPRPDILDLGRLEHPRGPEPPYHHRTHGASTNRSDSFRLSLSEHIAPD
jgi:hypothetical protein